MRQVATIFRAALLALLMAGPAAAEFELSIYSGYQTAPHSRAKGDYPGGGTYNALFGWEGRSFELPLYYGARGTWWVNDRFGWGFEGTHTKVYAPGAERNAAGFDRFELSDGHNIITANALRRWPNRWKGVTPHVGGGLGFAMPHVDVEPAGGPRTYGFQVTGPAVRLFAGASMDLSERWALFGEYQFTWSDNTADLDGGGSLETRIITNAVNLGVSYRF
ncbi:MAG: outer membrane protein [Rhodosalinus sp.]